MIYHIKHLLTAQIRALQSNNLFPFISNKYIKYQFNVILRTRYTKTAYSQYETQPIIKLSQ